MRRLAVFVEGYTEVLFVEKLVEALAGENQVQIELRRILGGTNARRRMKLLRALKPASGQRYYLLLVDCGGDEQVKDRILEEHRNLTSQNYAKIIGIRDVRPQYSRAEIGKLEAWLPKYVKTSLAPVEFVLSVMEIEAWFLSEHTHFPKIDPAITLEAIRANLGFDPSVDDMALRENPAADLAASYQIGGKKYEKSVAADTVNALDFARVYLTLPGRIPYLRKLADSIDQFLAAEAEAAS